MTIYQQNFSHQIEPEVGKETEFVECNFTQEQPVLDEKTGKMRGLRIFPNDDTPRTFIRCNMCNCEVPPGSTVEKCNTAIFEREVEDGVKEITVGTDTIEVANKFSRHWGMYDPKTLEIQYLEEPHIFPEASEEEQILQEKDALTAQLAVKTQEVTSILAAKSLARAEAILPEKTL